MGNNETVCGKRCLGLRNAGAGGGRQKNEATHELVIEDPGSAVSDSIGVKILTIHGARGCYEFKAL
jgi:hypothetical protein